MDLLWEGLREAFRLIASLDRDVMAAAYRSVWISVLSVSIASLIGLPVGTALARIEFPGRGILIVLCRIGMAFPTVFVGLVCFALFSRRGPLATLDWLYTPWAIVSGEFLLALPMVTSISHGAVKALDRRVAETLRTLGAGPLRRCWVYLSEARIGVTLAVLTAFSRCVTELGIAIMVGGNLKYRTRTLATAAALETGKGEFGRGLAMGLILLGVATGVTLAIVWLARESEHGER